MKSSNSSVRVRKLALQAQSLNITVNGSAMQIMQQITIGELLRQLELDSNLVAVEQNLHIVPKSEYSTRRISNEDNIEIVHFVG